MTYKHRIAVSIAILILAYLFGAFIAWKMNPGEWDETGKAFISLIAVVVIGIVNLFLGDVKL